MANGESDEWVGCLGLLAVAGAGWWLWSDHSKSVTAPAPVTASAFPVSTNPVAPATSANTVAPAPVQSPPPPLAPPPPSHRYDFVEGDVYGYIAAVSDEARKRGQVAGDVVTFRYLGFRNHEYHLEELNGRKEVIGFDSCLRPCVAVEEEYGGQVQRIANNPDSIIGAAFQDAMSGQLRKGRPIVAPPPSEIQPQVPTGYGPQPIENGSSDGSQ